MASTTSFLGLSTVYWSIPMAWGLSIAPHFYAISLSSKEPKPFDNAHPKALVAEYLRHPFSSLTPLQKKICRAEWANQNGFDYLPLFAASLVAASFTTSSLTTSAVNKLAMGYLASRVVYNLLYIFVTTDSVANLRSITYLTGMGIIFRLFLSAGGL